MFREWAQEKEEIIKLLYLLLLVFHSSYNKSMQTCVNLDSVQNPLLCINSHLCCFIRVLYTVFGRPNESSAECMDGDPDSACRVPLPVF